MGILMMYMFVSVLLLMGGVFQYMMLEDERGALPAQIGFFFFMLTPFVMCLLPNPNIPTASTPRVEVYKAERLSGPPSGSHAGGSYWSFEGTDSKGKRYGGLSRWPIKEGDLVGVRYNGWDGDWYALRLE